MLEIFLELNETKESKDVEHDYEKSQHRNQGHHVFSKDTKNLTQSFDLEDNINHEGSTEQVSIVSVGVHRDKEVSDVSLVVLII